jgi:NTP pyrophosphatase (non-canonical NTP hydrolase)
MLLCRTLVFSVDECFYFYAAPFGFSKPHVGSGIVISPCFPNPVRVIHMSIALRDAQHLSWKTFMKIGGLLGSERDKDWTASAMVTALLEEAGEVASAVKGLEESMPPEKAKIKEMLATELSDLMYTVFVLAEHYGIELEESFMQNMDDKIISNLH